jgi:hypothetical protein
MVIYSGHQNAHSGYLGMIAGIAAFIAGAVMLLLSGLGLMHARRTSPATEILSGHPAHARTPGTASSPLSDQRSDRQPADDALVAATPAAHLASPSDHELS